MIRRPSRELANADQIATLLDHVSMVLKTGISPRQAWLAVGDTSGNSAATELTRTVAHTPPSLLSVSSLSGTPESSSLRAVLMCVKASDETGAPLAPLISTLAQGLRDEADASRARQAAFAGAKTTAHVLMALPLFALLLGYAVGANPLGVLFGSSSGALMLTAGGTLTVLGWIWMGRLLARARPASHIVDPLIVLDTLAHILEAGLPLALACERLGHVLAETEPGPQLISAGESLIRGMQVEAVFAAFTHELNTLATAASISAATGARLSPLIFMSTKEARRARIREVERTAATLAVTLVLPTGVTILPAFIILGITPIITDLVTTHFGWMT